MNYTEINPSPPLDSYVKCFWILERNALDSPSSETIYPDGSIDLVFSYRDNQQASFLIGQQTRKVTIPERKKSLSIGVRFFPFGAHPFLNVPLKEITNAMINPGEIFGTDAHELTEKIFLKSPAQAVQCIENFLLKKLYANKTEIRQVSLAAAMLQAQHGNIRIETLSEKVNLTRRTLERKFEDATGLSPKSLARIFRFNSVRNALLRNPSTSFTTLAHQFDYYDQSHFIHDFNQFTSRSPSAFVKEVTEGRIHFNRYKFVAFLQSRQEK